MTFFAAFTIDVLPVFYLEISAVIGIGYCHHTAANPPTILHPISFGEFKLDHVKRPRDICNVIYLF